MDVYRSKYVEREPNELVIRNADECKQLVAEHGVVNFASPPMQNIAFGVPPRSHAENSASKTKYIWVVTKPAVPTVLERSPLVEFLSKKRATHTNLTGGGVAYSGGEVWFESLDRIYVSGASGRYPVRTPDELEEICKAFCRLGYDVVSFGWNEETEAPHTFYRR